MRWLVLVSLRYIRNDVRTADGAQSIIRFCCCCRYLLPFDEMTMITHFQIEHFSFIFFPYSAFVLTLPNGLFCVSFLFFLGHWANGCLGVVGRKNGEKNIYAEKKKHEKERTKHKHIPCNTFTEYIGCITVFLLLFILNNFFFSSLAFSFFSSLEDFSFSLFFRIIIVILISRVFVCAARR